MKCSKLTNLAPLFRGKIHGLSLEAPGPSDLEHEHWRFGLAKESWAVGFMRSNGPYRAQTINETLHFCLFFSASFGTPRVPPGCSIGSPIYDPTRFDCFKGIVPSSSPPPTCRSSLSSALSGVSLWLSLSPTSLFVTHSILRLSLSLPLSSDSLCLSLSLTPASQCHIVRKFCFFSDDHWSHSHKYVQRNTTKLWQNIFNLSLLETNCSNPRTHRRLEHQKSWAREGQKSNVE